MHKPQNLRKRKRGKQQQNIRKCKVDKRVSSILREPQSKPAGGKLRST